MSNFLTLDWALAVASASAVVHLAAPLYRDALKHRRAVVGSLGAGMAVAYVFLHLLRELDASESPLGRRIHFVVLVGFVTYYGIEYSLGLAEARLRPAQSDRHRFALDLMLNWVYGWLLLYTLPESLKTDGWAILPLLTAVGLHQAHADLELSGAYRQDFDSWGRFVLASAPLFGWMTDLMDTQQDALVSSVCTAVLAGSCLYKTFKHQLPETQNSRFRWFLCGVTVFTLLHFLAGVDFFSDRMR